MQNSLSLFFEINDLETYHNQIIIDFKPASPDFTEEEIMRHIKTSLLRLLIELEAPENVHPMNSSTTYTQEAVSNDTDMN